MAVATMAAHDTDTFASVCRREREARDWTQHEAAAAIGVNIRTYQRWERGETIPRPAERRCVARAFGLSGWWLRQLCRTQNAVRMP